MNTGMRYTFGRNKGIPKQKQLLDIGNTHMAGFNPSQPLSWSNELTFVYRPRGLFFPEDGSSLNAYWYMHDGNISHREQGNQYFNNTDDVLGYNFLGWSRADVLFAGLNYYDLVEYKFTIVNDKLTRTIKKLSTNTLLETKSVTNSAFIGASKTLGRILYQISGTNTTTPNLSLYSLKIDNLFFDFNESIGTKFYSNDGTVFWEYINSPAKISRTNIEGDSNYSYL